MPNNSGTDNISFIVQWCISKGDHVTKRKCFDLAIVCPDISCPKCAKPYQTWVWKENLLFTCPDCSELGFSIDGMSIKRDKLPKSSFIADLEMPCDDDPDPSCTRMKKMLFIENYEELDFLSEHFRNIPDTRNYSQMQKNLGLAFELIIDRITL